ncbi:DinQ-like type I toxin DqlB [Escherichia coli]|nr:DinQ-like type I toxin DqlB [Escherichia coli]
MIYSTKPAVVAVANALIAVLELIRELVD